jgi:polysaccharide export outer membrane protein
MKCISLFKKITALLSVILLFSCTSRKDVVYYQNIDKTPAQEKLDSYEIKIQADDLLMIVVSAQDPEIVVPFNLGSTSGSNTSSAQQYLVDSDGNIEFPILGSLKVGGLSRSEVLSMLKEKISVFVVNPIINLRITNFKISVQGEVAAPGTYPVASERVTLIEALTMAKDLTIYGKRDNILIIREVDGVKSYNRVDITKSDFINSPFYYLAQNDVIYVEPNKSKIAGAGVGPSTGLIFSVTSLLIAVITLIIRL